MIKGTIIFVAIQLILLVPSFYLYRRIVKKIKFRKVKITSFILTFLMPFIYTFIFLIIYSAIISPVIRSKKINQSIWIENISSRYKMIKHLEDSSILIGKNKQAVIIFLGEDFDENCYGKDTLCFVVNDPDNYAFLDHYEFIVFFDENGIVN